MKVVHVPFTFHPEPMGGTEVYVKTLSEAQRAMGIDPVIAAPGRRTERYAVDGLFVHRFAVTEQLTDVRELYGVGDAVAARAFGNILDEERPEVVHLHALTRGASRLLIREAMSREIPSVFTYHTPTVSCARGTLLRWGQQPCDGRVDTVRCAACRLQSLGVNRIASHVLGRVPRVVSHAVLRRGRAGGAWTALAMPELLRLQHSAFRDCMADVDHIVAVCEWAGRVLETNGVPRSKMSVSRAGIACDVRPVTERSAGPRVSDTIRAAFLGRLDATKGVDLVVDAMRSAPDLRVSLDIYGIVDSPASARYRDQLIAASAGDARIALHPPLPSRDVVKLLRGYDFVVVPSRWLETGPLIVLEAFAAATPVIGSNIGGIAELVSDGVDGILLPADSVQAWRTILRRVDRDREVLATLRRGIRPPRSMAAAAADMMTVYRRVIGGREKGSFGARPAHPLRSVH